MTEYMDTGKAVLGIVFSEAWCKEAVQSMSTPHVCDKARTQPEPDNEPDMGIAGLTMDRGAFSGRACPPGRPPPCES